MITRKFEQEVEEIRYVSEDDREFKTAEACREYEKSAEGKVSIAFFKLPKVEINTVDFGIPYNADYHEAYLIKPQDMEEITVLNLFMEQITGENKFFTPLSIGKTFLIDLGECRDWLDVYCADEYITNLKRNLQSYVNKINEKNRKDD